MNSDAEIYAVTCDERAARFNRRAQIVCKLGRLISALAALGLGVSEFACAALAFQASAVLYWLRSRRETRMAAFVRSLAKTAARLGGSVKVLDPDACCADERRNFSGGCVNCGAPCL